MVLISKINVCERLIEVDKQKICTIGTTCRNIWIEQEPKISSKTNSNNQNLNENSVINVADADLPV